MLKRGTLTFLIVIVAFVMIACGSTTPSDNTPSNSTASPTAASSTPAVASSPTVVQVPLHITGVSIGVSPGALATVSCNSTVNVVYTASIIAVEGNTGGSVAYSWTVGGANVSSGTVSFAPGDTTKTITYTLSGATAQYNNTTNMTAVLNVSTPNAIASAPTKPAGSCVYTGPFTVTGVGAAVSPADVSSIKCGTTVSLTYTATVTIAPNSPGGTVVLNVTIGPSTSHKNVVFSPGSTVQTYTLPPLTFVLTRTSIHTVTFVSATPNAVSASPARPSGACV